MRRIIGLLVILIGVGIFIQGYVLAHSMRGAAQKLGANMRAVWSGRAPLTPAMSCMIGGGFLVAAGTLTVFKK